MKGTLHRHSVTAGQVNASLLIGSTSEFESVSLALAQKKETTGAMERRKKRDSSLVVCPCYYW